MRGVSLLGTREYGALRGHLWGPQNSDAKLIIRTPIYSNHNHPKWVLRPPPLPTSPPPHTHTHTFSFYVLNWHLPPLSPLYRWKWCFGIFLETFNNYRSTYWLALFFANAHNIYNYHKYNKADRKENGFNQANFYERLIDLQCRHYTTE